MEVFKSPRTVRLKSHLGTYLCAVEDEDGGREAVSHGGREAVSHGYRRNSRGTVWAVELAGDDYVRFQGQRGLYLGATELPVDIDGGRGSRTCCRVVLGVPSTPNDNAFLWSPLREGEHLTLSGPYGRLLRARFGRTPQHNAVTVDFRADPKESSWVIEVVPAEESLPPPPLAPPCRARSCDARLEAATSASSVFARFNSVKESNEKVEEEPSASEEPLSKPAPRLIFYNTARDDGTVDDFDEGTWKYFPFNEQSLVELHRKLEGELTQQREDFAICRRSSAVPGLFPVVLDLPPGNKDMEFVLVPVSWL